MKYFNKCLNHVPGLHYRGGQRFAGASNLPISIVPHFKLTSVLILKEPCSIEKCATCLDTILELTACRIIKMNKKVYMPVRNMPNKPHLTDAESCMFSKLCLGSI